MKKKNLLYFLPILFLIVTSGKTEWKHLFNGKNLNNWDTYIGTPLKGFEDLHKKASSDQIFSVVEQNGENIIRISGEVNGSLATKDAFENYHLQLVFKWGKKVYTRQNSGLLYHSFGEFGAAIGTWMTNIECQLMHDKLGDTYLMNNTTAETSAEKVDDGKSFTYSKKANIEYFGENTSGRSIKKSNDYEKALGEWNTVDLFCFERTAVHRINGNTVMVNNNCGINTEDGIKALTSGKIQLQSEGGELFIKSIKIRKIKKLPKKILK